MGWRVTWGEAGDEFLARRCRFRDSLERWHLTEIQELKCGSVKTQRRAFFEEGVASTKGLKYQ